MELRPNALSLLLAGVAFAVRCANAATGDSPPALDPAFSAGLAKLKQATGFTEDPRSSTDWGPNLQLRVGVKAVEIIVDPARGAEMLLAGIRSIRAPDQAETGIPCPGPRRRNSGR